ncbi:hypothetical protein [Aquibacillus albus]|uniref:Uncharacterized protein n=1 Tax=Aquibacillus albus TaxID=1168171 RepID=A0ABS2N2W7_9BACI|nr:hypothetical protein [Aquibacillus albus]MBM7572497.1 hypothetical protein [Aquibacillus albus]
MSVIIIAIVSIYAVLYCFAYARAYIINGNKLAGSVYAIMVVIAMATPFVYFFGR